MNAFSTRFASLFVALGLLGAGFTGCASTPKLPDEPAGNKKHQYRSTKEDDSGTDNAQNNDGQGSDASQDGTRGGGGRAKPSSNSAGDGSIPRATGPVAHVNGEPVTADEFNQMMAKIAKSQRVNPRMLSHFQSRLIDKLVDRKLIEVTLDDAGIEVSKKEVDQKLDEVKKEFARAAQASGQKGTTLEDVAEKYGIKKKELRDSLRQSIAIEKYLTEKRGLDLPDPKDVRAFYDKNSSKFSQPERVHLHHIVKLVKGDAEEKVWEKTRKEVEAMRKKLAAEKADFAALAKKKSEGKFAKRGGDLGFQTEKSLREKVDPALAKAAFALDKGELSEPVKSKFGWHLLKVSERKAAQTVPFEKVKAKIEKRLKNKRIQGELKKWVDEIRGKADIKKHPENIE